MSDLNLPQRKLTTFNITYNKMEMALTNVRVYQRGLLKDWLQNGYKSNMYFNNKFIFR
jgi:hypothetical protein